MNKTILVTGSSRGIGKAIALYLAERGFDLVLHCRSRRAEAEAVANDIERLGRTARILQFDIADRAQCAERINADIEAFGAYYGVVCNAGITADNAFPSLTGEQWDSVVHTNLDGFYNVLQPVIMMSNCWRQPWMALSSIVRMAKTVKNNIFAWMRLISVNRQNRMCGIETIFPIFGLEVKRLKKKPRTLSSSRNVGWLKSVTPGSIGSGKYWSAMRKWIGVI